MKVIKTTNAPGAVGPYSQAIEIDNLVFASGQIALNPATGEMAEGIEAQYRSSSSSSFKKCSSSNQRFWRKMGKCNQNNCIHHKY